MKTNKKGSFTLSFMAFLFIAQIFIVLFLFLGIGLHFIMYDYAITPAAQGSIDALNVSGALSTNTTTLINNAKSSYLSQAGVFDIMIFAFMIVTFIQSCIGAFKARRIGFWSFYGYLTLGYMLLAVLIMFALQIRDWILNEIFYKIITETFSARLTFWFINYPYIWGSIWFIVLLVLQFVDFTTLAERAGLLGNDNQGEEFQ